MQKRCFSFAATILMPCAASYASPCNAQGTDQPVGMILFPVMRDQNNQQYIINRGGYKVNIQGAGIAKDAKQIAVYQDNANNFWYMNKKGQPTEVNPQQMAKIQGQIQSEMHQGQMNGAYPNGAAPSQNVTVNNQTPSSGGGSSALGTGLAAFGGAMGGAAVGAAMTGAYNQPYYGVPYGHPVYRAPNNGQYYYHGASGNNVYVAPTKQTSAMFNEYNHQGAWKDRDQWAANSQNWNKDQNWNNAAHNANLNNAGHNDNLNTAAHADAANRASGGRFGNRLRGAEQGGGGGRRFGGRFR